MVKPVSFKDIKEKDLIDYIKDKDFSYYVKELIREDMKENKQEVIKKKKREIWWNDK